MKWQGLIWGKDFETRIFKEQFKIHSIFDSVCNLQSSVDQPLLCLITKTETLAQNALLVESDKLHTYFVKGMPMYFTQDLLCLGPVKVDCSQMRRYQPAVRHLSQKQDVYRAVRLWMDTQWPGWDQSDNRVTLELAYGLLEEDEQRLLWALDKYIGFGEGLTPSGDDYISGIMLSYMRGLFIEFGDKAFAKKLSQLIKRLNGCTNAISYTMLWYAVHGEGASYLTKVVDTLYSDNYQALSLSSKLFKVGASSGRYLLAGILLGCELFRRKEKWKNERRSSHQAEHICRFCDSHVVIPKGTGVARD